MFETMSVLTGDWWLLACLCEDKILDDLCCFLLLFQSMCLVLEEEGGNRDLQTYQRIVQPFFNILWTFGWDSWAICYKMLSHS